MKCSGNKKQICGAKWRNNVFVVGSNIFLFNILIIFFWLIIIQKLKKNRNLLAALPMLIQEI
jgi:hypothetical protein